MSHCARQKAVCEQVQPAAVGQDGNQDGQRPTRSVSPAAGFAQKATQVCPEWPWLFLHHTASPGTYLPQGHQYCGPSPMSIRWGGEGPYSPTWVGWSRGMGSQTSPFPSPPCTEWCKRAGMARQQWTPSRWKIGYFQRTVTGSDLPSANRGFWRSPQTGVSGGARRPAVHKGITGPASLLPRVRTEDRSAQNHWKQLPTPVLQNLDPLYPHTELLHVATPCKIKIA